MYNIDRSFACRFEPSWATTMSGTDEGMYGWVAVNYALGRLSPEHISQAPSSKSIRFPIRNETVDVLDLGGASVEGTVEPRGQSYIGAPGAQLVNIAGEISHDFVAWLKIFVAYICPSTGHILMHLFCCLGWSGTDCNFMLLFTVKTCNKANSRKKSSSVILKTGSV